MCDMARAYVWRDSFTCVTWLMQICAWLIHTRDMTHSHEWHDSYTCCRTWEYTLSQTGGSENRFPHERGNALSHKLGSHSHTNWRQCEYTLARTKKYTLSRTRDTFSHELAAVAIHSCTNDATQSLANSWMYSVTDILTHLREWEYTVARTKGHTLQICDVTSF